MQRPISRVGHCVVCIFGSLIQLSLKMKPPDIYLNSMALFVFFAFTFCWPSLRPLKRPRVMRAGRKAKVCFPTSFGGACGGIDLLRAVPTDTPGCEMRRRFSLSENIISIHGAAISFLFMDLLSSRTGMEFVWRVQACFNTSAILKLQPPLW